VAGCSSAPSAQSSSNSNSVPGTTTVSVPKVHFVLDLSGSTEAWNLNHSGFVQQWLEKNKSQEWNVSFSALDAFSGGSNCISQTREIGGGSGENSDTKEQNRLESMGQLISDVDNWVRCEKNFEYTSGSDLNLKSFEYAERVVVISDGILVPTKGQGITINGSNLSDLDSVKAEVSNYLESQAIDLSRTAVEVYGLGFQTNLSGIELNNLIQSWEFLLDQAGASSYVVRSEFE
jgi:hypothetical protein